MQTFTTRMHSIGFVPTNARNKIWPPLLLHVLKLHDKLEQYFIKSMQNLSSPLFEKHSVEKKKCLNYTFARKTQGSNIGERFIYANAKRYEHLM